MTAVIKKVLTKFQSIPQFFYWAYWAVNCKVNWIISNSIIISMSTFFRGKAMHSQSGGYSPLHKFGSRWPSERQHQEKTSNSDFQVSFRQRGKDTIKLLYCETTHLTSILLKNLINHLMVLNTDTWFKSAIIKLVSSTYQIWLNLVEFLFKSFENYKSKIC